MNRVRLKIDYIIKYQDEVSIAYKNKWKQNCETEEVKDYIVDKRNNKKLSQIKPKDYWLEFHCEYCVNYKDCTDCFPYCYNYYHKYSGGFRVIRKIKKVK